MTRFSEALLAALPMILAGGCVPDITVIKADASGGQNGGASGGAGGVREPNGGNTTLGGSLTVAGTGNEAGQGGASVGDDGQPGGNGGSPGGESSGGAMTSGSAGEPNGYAGGGAGGASDGGGAGGAGAGTVVPWPPELLASEGHLLNDFDDLSRKDDRDECLDLESRRRMPSKNHLGFCSECFGDCNGSLGGQIETNLEDAPEKAFRGHGQSLRLEFDVSQSASGCMTQFEGDPSHRYAGYVEALAGNPTCPDPARGAFNLASLGFVTLTFWLRAETDVAQTMELALKDTGDPPGQSYKRPLAPYVARASGSFDGWIKVCVPLQDLSFANPEHTELVDFTRLGEINITFNARLPGSRKGIVYLDEIAFERAGCPN